MTLFHLIRHGAYPLLGQTLAGRMPGQSLSDAGRAQAERIAERLSREAIAAVIASPRERTLETAAPIAAACGCAVTIDAALDEVDFGEWTGREFVALNADPAWRDYNVRRPFAAPPGGETIAAVQARALAALLRLHASYPSAELALVSHGDVIKAALLAALGAPLAMLRSIAIDPGSRSVLALGPAGAEVRALNLPPGA